MNRDAKLEKLLFPKVFSLLFALVIFSVIFSIENRVYDNVMTSYGYVGGHGFTYFNFVLFTRKYRQSLGDLRIFNFLLLCVPC